jgi:hypothetical protein
MGSELCRRVVTDERESGSGPEQGCCSEPDDGEVRGQDEPEN